MMRPWLLLLALLLAACAPQVVYVTPGAAGDTGSGDVLPVEAQRVIDRATATAAVAATDSARATALRLVTQQALQDARDAATLSAAQTQQAFQVAVQAGAATQGALGTSAVQTQAAAQTQAWATPTWAALGTQAAAARAGISASATAIAVSGERNQAGADGYRNLWGAAVAVGTLAMLALAAITVYWANERQKARQATVDAVEAERRDRERLETERAAVELERARLELLKSMMVERDGQPWVIAPGGRLLPMLPGGVPTASHPNLAREWRWRAALKKTVYCGIELGGSGKPRFGERDLASGPYPWIINQDGTGSSTGYRQINRILRKVGIWTTSGRDTSFTREWTISRFEAEFDLLPLPELPDCEPPEVRIPQRSSPVAAIARDSTVPQSGE